MTTYQTPSSVPAASFDDDLFSYYYSFFHDPATAILPDPQPHSALPVAMESNVKKRPRAGFYRGRWKLHQLDDGTLNLALGLVLLFEKKNLLMAPTGRKSAGCDEELRHQSPQHLIPTHLKFLATPPPWEKKMRWLLYSILGM
ncbi:hypothetical protein C4D60_Mb05t24280 [Musa balbisiana]|uniref:Uncharacterized protein n=1 Tax=Musa balbisiana TaxID=52838 RepID=A0A4S8JYH7_MUSBA|nr:hypothetical protein C4D60_Mb05t24280 [Musa balbisiana]